MFSDTKAYSGIAVKDASEAKRFYGETLGIGVTDLEPGMLLQLELAGGDRPTLIYAQPGMEPASYTVLNFPVAEIVSAVTALKERGVEFQTYDDMGDFDEHGVFRGEGPAIAWFTDPSGNVLSVIEDDDA